MLQQMLAQVLNMWNCTEIAGQRYLTNDFRVTCDDATWYMYSAWAPGAVVLYILGV